MRRHGVMNERVNLRVCEVSRKAVAEGSSYDENTCHTGSPSSITRGRRIPGTSANPSRYRLAILRLRSFQASKAGKLGAQKSACSSSKSRVHANDAVYILALGAVVAQQTRTPRDFWICQS